MSVDILGTSWDQCRSMVQYSFTSTETRRLVRADSPGRPPRLSHSSWTMYVLLFVHWLSRNILTSARRRRQAYAWVLSCSWHCGTVHVSVQTTHQCHVTVVSHSVSVSVWLARSHLNWHVFSVTETAQEMSPDGLSCSRKPCDYSGKAHGRAGLEKTSQWCHSTCHFD